MHKFRFCLTETDEGGTGGGAVTVEEVNIEAPAPVSPDPEPEPPRDELEVGYRYGQLEARLAAMEAAHTQALERLAAFEAATVAALETEQAELERVTEVVVDVAEEVLPPEHDAANAVNPEHQAHKPKWWEGFIGGHHHHGRL